AGDEVPVVCYPRRWDSVSFYLKRDDVRAYARAEWGELADRLASCPLTLLFVESEAGPAEGVRDPPPSVEFGALGGRGNATAGLVRPRARTLPAGAGGT